MKMEATRKALSLSELEIYENDMQWNCLGPQIDQNDMQWNCLEPQICKYDMQWNFLKPQICLNDMQWNCLEPQVCENDMPWNCLASQIWKKIHWTQDPSAWYIDPEKNETKVYIWPWPSIQILSKYFLLFSLKLICHGYSLLTGF